MKFLLSIMSLLVLQSVCLSQRLITKDAEVRFQSKTTLENIEAVNKKGAGIINTQTGEIEFSVLMKGFEFKKALMQEHFNENYVESDKYPKATYKGKLLAPVRWKEDGVYKTEVEGELTLHGVTRPQKATATVTIKNGIVSGTAGMVIVLEEYQIKVPALARASINKSIAVLVTVASFSSINN